MSEESPQSPRQSTKTPVIARHGRLKKSNGFVTVAKLLAAALAVLLVSGISVAGIAAFDLASSVAPGVSLVGEDTEAAMPQIGAIDGGANILLVGSDSRQGQDPVFGGASEEGVLNDVTMLMHISQDHKNVTVVSFPRDMFVPIPECPDPSGGTFSAMSSQKINTTLGYGGLACTVLTVENLTGLNIPYAAMVQFGGVIAMSNAVGGVPVCVASEIQDDHTDTYLKPGEHTLSGMAALQFLRTRHGVGDGSDLTRISNQQLFMSSLVRTIKSADTLGNPAKVYSLAKAALTNMTFSNSLKNVDTITSIALALKDIDLSKVVFAQYPTGTVEGGVVPIEDAATALNTALQNDTPVKLTGETGGSVLESTSTPKPTESSEPTATCEPSDSATASATPKPTSTADAATELPSDVKGQSADEETCSSGRTLNDQ